MALLQIQQQLSKNNDKLPKIKDIDIIIIQKVLIMII